jgi:hypothetical protein
MLGARLAQQLGIKTSWMTVLRRIMALPSEPVQQVVELGIDDFAWKRGRKWGTILVDMQSHKVIDILPDRSAETAAAWIATHPEIEAGRVEIGVGTIHQQPRQPLPKPSNVRTDFTSSSTLAKHWRGCWPAIWLHIEETRQKSLQPFLSPMCQ